MDLDILINQLSNMQRKAYAFDQMSEYIDEAQAYSMKYLMPGAWGSNVWVAILKDAIRLRNELALKSGN